jgi:hypothetical protein
VSRHLLLAAALSGCGVPSARHAALADAFDAAAAARDRAQAELDACAAAAAAREEAERAAAAPAQSAHAALARVAAAVGGTQSPDGAVTLDPAPWFLPGTADLADAGRTSVPALGAALGALPPGLVRVEVAVGEVPPSREYPTARHLAGDRAIAIVAALEAAGVPAERLVAAARPGPSALVVGWAAP